LSKSFAFLGWIKEGFFAGQVSINLQVSKKGFVTVHRFLSANDLHQTCHGCSVLGVIFIVRFWTTAIDLCAQAVF
jgi:hypothetical protein